MCGTARASPHFLSSEFAIHLTAHGAFLRRPGWTHVLYFHTLPCSLVFYRLLHDGEGPSVDPAPRRMALPVPFPLRFAYVRESLHDNSLGLVPCSFHNFIGGSVNTLSYAFTLP